MNLLLLIACEVVEPLGIDFNSSQNDTSSIFVETGTIEPAEEPSDEQVIDPKNVVGFGSPSDCERLGLFTMTLTRMLPGTLNPSYPTDPVLKDPSSAFLDVSNERYGCF